MLIKIGWWWREYLCRWRSIRLRTGWESLERCSQEDHMFNVLSWCVVSRDQTTALITCFRSSFNNLWSKIVTFDMMHIMISYRIYKLVFKDWCFYIWCITLSIRTLSSCPHRHCGNILKHLFQQNIIRETLNTMSKHMLVSDFSWLILNISFKRVNYFVISAW